MALDLDIGFDSRAGRKPENQDFAAALLPGAGDAALGAIAAIADGVSTGSHGREAAQTTVTTVVRDYYATPHSWDTTVALDRVIAAQNQWLAGINRRRAPDSGLTTLTVLVLRGHGWSLAHVGDTRAYLLRGGELTRLTHDHVAGPLDMRHQLVRAIGADERVLVDYLQGDLLVGDVFLLLSDGVHGVLSEKRLAGLATDALAQERGGAQALSSTLSAVALQRGSPDNVTALVVHVRGLQDATLDDARRRTDVLPVPPRLKVGEVFEGLTVEQLVADNGINLVYRVHHALSGRRYALKTLAPERAHDAEERAMLAHEAWLAQRLATAHAGQHLVALHERVPGGPVPAASYLLYDWHEGESLAQLLARGHVFPLAQTLQLVTQAARALSGLHRQGVVHRDVKPDNLHQGADGVLRLLDLGVALSGRESAATRHLHAGTPSYINPEQWGFKLRAGSAEKDAEPEPPDAQSDLFALGVTLYQLLTGGRLPYGEVLPYQAGRYWRDPVAPSRHNPLVPIWLDHIALKAVARDKRQRFETAEELLLALERGASRPLQPPAATPLIQRDPTALWKVLLGVSALLNALLVYWLVFLPR